MIILLTAWIAICLAVSFLSIELATAGWLIP